MELGVQATGCLVHYWIVRAILEPKSGSVMFLSVPFDQVPPLTLKNFWKFLKLRKILFSLILLYLFYFLYLFVLFSLSISLGAAGLLVEWRGLVLGEKSLYWIVSPSARYSVIAMITAVKVAVPFL